MRPCLLYYITDRTAFPGDEPSRRRQLLEKIREAAQAGVDYMQLREKDLPPRDLELLAKQAVTVIRETRQPAALLINCRTDVALAVQANGVHLRSNDISPEEARMIWTKCGTKKYAAEKCGAATPARQPSPPDPIIAVSCHAPAEVADAAGRDATFAVFGPVLEKQNARPAGLELLRKACQANIPVLALGGVTLANAHACLAAGAAGVAAIRLFQDNDIAAVIKQLRR